MRQIRYGVFETNSSTEIALTMMTDEEYQAFKKGELYFNQCDYNIVSANEVYEKLIEVGDKDEIKFIKSISLEKFTQCLNEIVDENTPLDDTADQVVTILSNCDYTLRSFKYINDCYECRECSLTDKKTNVTMHAFAWEESC